MDDAKTNSGASKSEKLLNTFGESRDGAIFISASIYPFLQGDRVEKFSDKASPYKAELEQEMDAIKPPFERLVEGSKVLLDALDEISKIHPFISGKR